MKNLIYLQLIAIYLFGCTSPAPTFIQIEPKEIQANIAIQNFNPNYDLPHLKWQISKLNYLHKAVVDINCKKDGDKKNAFTPKSVLLYNLSIAWLDKDKDLYLYADDFQKNMPPSDSSLTIAFYYTDSLDNFYCASSTYFLMAGLAPFSGVGIAQNLPKICYGRGYPNSSNDIAPTCLSYDKFEDYATHTQYLQIDSLAQDNDFMLFILQNPDSVHTWLQAEALRRAWLKIFDK